MNPFSQHQQIPFVVYRGDEQRESASRLASKLGVEASSLADFSDLASSDSLYVLFDEKCVSLNRGSLTMHGDFSSMIPRLSSDRLSRELLIRAARTKGRSGDALVVDATAGMGTDALLLSAAGFRVHLYERNPIIAALLADALVRAQRDDRLCALAERMQLFSEDSIEALPHYESSADIIVLDPMFPERTKSAAVKKKFQLIHEIEQPCIDEEALLRAAIAAQPRRIIVKRPIKGPSLANIKPHHKLVGKAVRYDCIEVRSLKQTPI